MQISKVLITYIFLTVQFPRVLTAERQDSLHIIPIMVSHFLSPSNTLDITTTPNYKNIQGDKILGNKTIFF